MSDNNLSADQLFLGLTRPVMFFGVHYMMVVINFMGSGLLYINKVFGPGLQSMYGPVMIFVIIHLACYLICLKEARAIELLLTRFGKCSKCKNRGYYKTTNSYDLS